MSNYLGDDGGYERHQEEVSEAVDGGGCAETWETLSEQRARRDDAVDDRRPDIEGTLLDIGCLRFTDDGEKIRWARGYYAGTAGHVSSETVENYIDRHKEAEA